MNIAEFEVVSELVGFLVGFSLFKRQENRLLRIIWSYSLREGIPFVVIYGEGEREKWIYKLKNMQSWEEQEVPLH